VSLLVVAMPSVAKPKGPPATTPLCAKLSRTAVANLVGIGPMVLDRTIGPYCTFVGAVHKHYIPMLELAILPYSASLWSNILSASHGVNHYSKSLVFAQDTKTSEGLQSCHSSSPPPEAETGPSCNSQPNETVIVTDGYGTDKSVGQKVIVVTSVTGQQGDVHLSHQIVLVQKILSGTIH
jgi:hypothetical protein